MLIVIQELIMSLGDVLLFEIMRVIQIHIIVIRLVKTVEIVIIIVVICKVIILIIRLT